VSAVEVLVVVAVLIGMSVQSAIGFGFAFFAAPAAFAAFAPEQAVLCVLILGVPINCLVLFAEGRRARVASGPTATVIVAALPGMLAGAWVVSQVDRDALQALVGVIVLAAALAQALATRAGSPARPQAAAASPSPAEIGGGLASGVLSTSVSINGPPLVLTFSHLGLRGALLRDSLAAALLALTFPAAAIVLAVGGGETALPDGWVLLACVPAVLVGHRFGAGIFRRLDDGTHHRAALGAAAAAGVLSIAAAAL
jgi:uncharacterized membrane protein YfcA